MVLTLVHSHLQLLLVLSMREHLSMLEVKIRPCSLTKRNRGYHLLKLLSKWKRKAWFNSHQGTCCIYKNLPNLSVPNRSLNKSILLLLWNRRLLGLNHLSFLLEATKSLSLIWIRVKELWMNLGFKWPSQEPTPRNIQVSQMPRSL